MLPGMHCILTNTNTNTWIIPGIQLMQTTKEVQGDRTAEQQVFYVVLSLVLLFFPELFGFVEVTLIPAVAKNRAPTILREQKSISDNFCSVW